MLRKNRRRVSWILLAASLLGAACSASGYVMAGSFTISNPERLTYWHRVGTLYGVAVIGFLLLAVALSVYLIRSRQHPDLSRA
jgi:membrane protein DedA with SNARE-associated domain